MTLLRNLTLRRGSCGASGKGPDHWTMFLPADVEQAKRFISGYDDVQPANI